MVPKINILPRSTTMVERLNRFYDVFHGEDRVLIVINADPDAIACAMAMKRLLWRRVSAVTMARTNVIKRPDNLALINFLKLHILHLNDVKKNEFSRFAMVDSQPSHFPDLADLAFNAVIDHHPLGKCKAAFMDIRPDYGSCSTMLTEYLRAAKIKPSRNLATALFYGIKTDTSNFVRQGQLEDMRAFRFLFPLINQNMVSKIENSEITRNALKYFRLALDRLKIRNGAALAYVGRVDNPDTLVLIADFLMRVHAVNRGVTAGIFKDQLVAIFRVAGSPKNAGRLAMETLGAFGSAGGHKAMARAEVPLVNLEPKLVDKEPAMERFLLKRLGSKKNRSKTKRD
ncbi:MAG: DHH family phosphoesterase [Pseudomonadota bacterium]